MADTQKIEITDNNELSLKEIRETFYHCRDFEITNLWQRSVFLFGFILACFTGYGAILISLLTTKVEHPNLSNLIECAISIIGIIFSIIWTMMAKGSKTWYEIYEKAIGLIEHSDKANNVFVKVPFEYRMGNYCSQYRARINDCLFSTKGGKYSPSKLNIFIGQVLIVIWAVCFFGHFTMLLYNSKKCECLQNILKCIYKCKDYWYVILSIALALIVGIVLWRSWKHLKSSCIEEI